MAIYSKDKLLSFDNPSRKICEQLEDIHAQGSPSNLAYMAEADTDLRFYLNDQTIFNDLYGNVPALKRRQLAFNHIKIQVDTTYGYQINNRKQSVATPVENGDGQTADQLTKILMWNNAKEGVLETVSEAFRGGLITGMNLLEVWLDFREDPISGNIKVDRLPYNSFMIDPFFRKADLSDCNYIWKRSFITLPMLASMYPHRQEELSDIAQIGSDFDYNVGVFPFMPENFNWAPNNLIAYDQFYYRDYRKQKLLVNKRTGAQREWRGTDKSLREFVNLFQDIKVMEQVVPTVRLALLANGKLLHHGPNTLGVDKYPFVPVFCYYHPESPYFHNRVMGLVRGLRDTQFLYNRRKVIELAMLESQITTGWKFKENALVNPDDAYLTGQGKALVLKKGAQMTDVEMITSPGISPTILKVSESLGEEFTKISGVNEAMMGQDLSYKAGLQEMMRQGAGLTSLQGVFANLDRSQKLLDQLRIEVIQSNFVPAKVERILQEQPTQEFYSRNFGKYDVIVEEGYNTSTQRQARMAELIQLEQVRPGLVPSEWFIESSSFQGKQKYVAQLQQQEQAQQQQQQIQQQMQMQEAQARTELAKARAVADRGLGVERMSRIEENQALAEERKQEAFKDHYAGLLDIVKAMKELDNIDILQIEKYLTLAQMLKGQVQPVVQQSIAGERGTV